MAVDTNLEREFKFDIDPDFDPPDLRPLVGSTERLPEQHLTTTYFDTPDHRLWARGITLRHRLEAEGDSAAGQPGKWTLKVPAPSGPGRGHGGPDGMARTELTWKGRLSEIPAEAAAIVAGLVRRSRLEPVAVLATERRRLLLHGHEADDRGAPPHGPWAEIDDDLVTVASGTRQGLRFRQLEIELLGGEPAGTTGPTSGGRPGPPVRVDAVLAELRRAGAEPGGAPKFALAAGLDTSRGPQGGSGKDVPSAVRQILSGDLGRLLEWDYRLRVPDSAGDQAALDVEAVRQAAVASRRLRSDLHALGAVLDPVWSQHVRADLKWVGRLLGRLRDEDALVERIRAGRADEGEGTVGAGDDAEAVEELVRLVRSDRHLGATELCEALASERYTDMLDRLHAASEIPPLVGATGDDPADAELGATLESVVGVGWRRLQAEIDDLGPDPGHETLRHVRIAAGRLRYAAEAAEPYLGKRAHRTAKAAHRLQSVLGDLRDAAAAAHTLQEVASHPSVTPAVAFVAGRLAGRAEGEAAALGQKWQKPAKKLAKGSGATWPP